MSNGIDCNEIFIQIRKARTDLDYNTTDIHIWKVMDYYNSKYKIILDKFPTNLWDDKKQSAYIEEVFIGTYYFDNNIILLDESPLIVLDGRQRIITLSNFYNDKLELQGLKRLTNLNGCKWSDLNLPIKRIINFNCLRVVILRKSALQFYK